MTTLFSNTDNSWQCYNINNKQITTLNHRFLVKTVSNEEDAFFKHILPDYYEVKSLSCCHVSCHSFSCQLLWHLFSLFHLSKPFDFVWCMRGSILYACSRMFVFEARDVEPKYSLASILWALQTRDSSVSHSKVRKRKKNVFALSVNEKSTPSQHNKLLVAAFFDQLTIVFRFIVTENVFRNDWVIHETYDLKVPELVCFYALFCCRCSCCAKLSDSFMARLFWGISGVESESHVEGQRSYEGFRLER